MGIDTEALAEVDVIISMMPKEDYIKIPNGFKNFIKTRKSTEYKPNIKDNIPLYQQELKKDTKTLCSLIYRSYLCTKEKKIELENEDRDILKQKELELREKYNPDNIFKNKLNVAEINIEPKKEEKHTALIEYTEQKWYQKIFSKILKIFKRS